MLNALAWTFGLYLAIKFCHLIASPSSGYGETESTIATKIRAGEPMLLIGTLAVSATIIVFTTWWSHRFAENQYRHASDCYAKMSAAARLPNMPASLGGFQAVEAVRGYRKSAVIHGGQLGIRRDVIDKKLEQARDAYSKLYADLAAKNARPAIVASLVDLDRCLRGEWEPHGEILRP
jgi:hypothetical protein